MSLGISLALAQTNDRQVIGGGTANRRGTASNAYTGLIEQMAKGRLELVCVVWSASLMSLLSLLG